MPRKMPRTMPGKSTATKRTGRKAEPAAKAKAQTAAEKPDSQAPQHDGGAARRQGGGAGPARTPSGMEKPAPRRRAK
jgi:hypothetical protein